MRRVIAGVTIAAAGFVAGCTSPVPANPPAASPAAPAAQTAPTAPADATAIRTVADERLRKVVLRKIAMAESAGGEIGAPGLVSVTPISREGISVLEHWVVDSNGKRAEYRVLFRPSPQGGTDVGVGKVSD